MSHPAAPPESGEQIRMREFYSEMLAKECTTVGWGRAKDGSYLAPYARNAWAAWQEARSPVEQKLSQAVGYLRGVGDDCPALAPWCREKAAECEAMVWSPG